MIRTLLSLPLCLAVALLAAAAHPAASAAGDDDTEKKPRKPSGIAPSLPALTRAEEDKLDDIIDRFIRADTGRLRGAEGRAAIREFEALKMEAVPALIRGLNRAAKMNQSCPVLMISKKLDRLLSSSNDMELLQYARDEIGAGVGRVKYSGNLANLRVKCMLRRNALARTATTTTARPPLKGPAGLTTASLVKAAGTASGDELKGIVTELAKRDGKGVLDAIATVAGSSEGDAQKAGREALDAHLGRQSMSAVKEALAGGSPEVRRAAVRVAAGKHAEHLVFDVIAVLTDRHGDVRAEARRALKKLAKDEKDFGPADDATAAQQREAQKKWRDWWVNNRRKQGDGE